MRIQEVCKSFIDGETKRSHGTVSIKGDYLYSYSAAICRRDKHSFTLLDPYRHSITTTRHMNLIYRELVRAKVEFVDETIYKLNREKRKGSFSESLYG